MNGPIKAEDITQEILELAMERFEDAYWNDVTAQDVANFLHDCIEAGLVSPPVKCMRFQGVLQRENCVPMVCVDAPKLSPQLFVSYEHWKGQTE